MDNPFSPRPRLSDLLPLLNSDSPLAQPNPFAPSNLFGSLSPSVPPPPTTDSFANLLRAFSPPTPAPSLPIAPTVNALIAPEVKRKVYFAFDFDDLFRVNNVRQIGKIAPREQRNPRTFTDRSIWESRNIKSEENLKKLMRNAVKFSSAVCVLAGTNTWQSRWVKYEIARAVIDERGLLAVHINSINHNHRQMPDRQGISPLYFLGVYRDGNDRYYLYERHVVVTDALNAKLGFEWRPYEDYTDPIPLPRYIQNLSIGWIMPLSAVTYEYDMVSGDGFNNLGAWIDTAANQAGR